MKLLSIPHPDDRRYDNSNAAFVVDTSKPLCIETNKRCNELGRLVSFNAPFMYP
jgi:hypothetical protein